MESFTESTVEQAALAWLESVGWSVRHGPEIAPGGLTAERSDYGQVVLEQRLRDALAQLNRSLPAEALDDAFRKLTRPEGAELSARNRAVHRLLVDGVTVEYRTPDGEIRGAQAPVQAESRAHMRALLQVAAGGVVFTTIHKFFPEDKGDRHPTLSERHNIVVIADEAHRSQYDFIDGFARHMRDALPHASFIGFTGTPIELQDANTRAVFGDYISVYDIQRAVQNGATVPIYYESASRSSRSTKPSGRRSTRTSRTPPRARRSSARRSSRPGGRSSRPSSAPKSA